MSKFGFSIFRPNQPTCFQSSSTLLVELLMDLCFFRLAEAFKTCFGLIFTFEPSVSWLSISIFIYIYIYIYLHYMMIIRSCLPRHWGLFVVQRSRLPVFFPATVGGELPEFVPELRVAWMCEGVNNFPCYWCIYIYVLYIHIYTHVCVLYMLSVYTM